jgi:hypothetical protein
MNENDAIDQFCKEHRARVLNTNKRASKIHKMDVNFFNYSHDYNIVDSSKNAVRCETEPLYTIEISQSELQRVADFERNVFNNLKEHGHYNLFETLMRQKEEERRLIDSNAAVRKAYEQYSLLLHLAKSGELKQC